MKIIVFTFASANNYGSKLQAYSLYRYLTEQGHKVDIAVVKNAILSDYFAAAFDLLIYRNLLWLFNKHARSFKKSLKAAVKTKTGILVNEITFDGYNEHLRIVSRSKLRKLNNDYDAFISGSDQVFSPLRIPPKKYYFLTFAHKRKISYAASFGVDVFPKFNRSIFRYIERFDYVSVRESTGKTFIDNNCRGVDCSVVLDPVFLIPRSEWESKTAMAGYDKKYVFVYFLNKADDTISKIISYCESNGIEIRTPEDAAPENFLNLIANAECVCTDSFHAVAFSIIFRKDFLCFKRNIDPAIQQESRIVDLLKRLSIKNRYFERFDDSCFACEPIDYACVETVLNEQIRKSKRFLEESLRSINDAVLPDNS